MFELGKVLAKKGNRLVIELDEEPSSDYLELLSDGKPLNISFRFEDNRMMSDKQRKLIFSLINDLSKFYGYDTYDQRKLEEFMFEMAYQRNIDLGNCQKQDASAFIDLMIEQVMRDGVQLSSRYKYLLDDTNYFYQCVKYRRCCVCGKDADIHHVRAVGMGMNRRYVDHSKYPLEALCRVHHTECHKIGQNSFDSKYKLTPVYLDIETIKRLKMANKGFLEELERDKGAENDIEG